MTKRKKPERKALRRETGYVWCDRHGEIHDDTLDPYSYGEGDEDLCVPENHSPVYRSKRPNE